MFKYEIRTTHDFLFYRIDVSADFNKLPNLSEFEDQLDALVIRLITKVVMEHENDSDDIDPVNGIWNSEDKAWEDGWYEGNLDKKRHRSYHFPDPCPSMQDNGSNGESYLCPRDLLDQFKITLEDNILSIEYLFLPSDNDVKTLVKQINKLYSRHIQGEVECPSQKLLNSIIVNLASSSLTEEEIVARAKRLKELVYGPE